MKTTHTHHIIPKHMGGTDEPSNLKEVTIKEHALEHKILYKKYGHWQDKLAYQVLSGQITNYEASQLKRRFGRLGVKTSIKTRRLLSKMKIGNKNALGNKARLGQPHSEETKRKLSLKKIGKKNPMFGKTGLLNPFGGKKHSMETKKRISESVKLAALKRKQA